MATSPGHSPPPTSPAPPDDPLAPLPAQTALPPGYGPAHIGLPHAVGPGAAMAIARAARGYSGAQDGAVRLGAPGRSGMGVPYPPLPPPPSQLAASAPGSGPAPPRKHPAAQSGNTTSRDSSPLSDVPEDQPPVTDATAGASTHTAVNSTSHTSLSTMPGYTAPEDPAPKAPRRPKSPEITFTHKRRKPRTKAQIAEDNAAAAAKREAERAEKRAAKRGEEAAKAERRAAREARAKAAAAIKRENGRGDGDAVDGDGAESDRVGLREPGRELQSPFSVPGTPPPPPPGATAARRPTKKRALRDEGEGGTSPAKRAKTAKPKPDGMRQAVERAIAEAVRTGRYIKMPRDRGGRAGALSEADIRTLLRGKTVEVQLAACLRARYASWTRCFHCVKKSGTDSCRYRYFRCFPIDPETTAITGDPYFQSREEAEALPDTILEYNRSPDPHDRQRIKACVAPALLPLITRELQHIVATKALTRPLPMNDRALCDFCSVTIFGGSFFCKCCGREYCLSCHDFMPSSINQMRDSPQPLDDSARPRLMTCFYSRKHAQPDMIPISRFTEASLRRHWLALASFRGQEQAAVAAVQAGRASEDALRERQEDTVAAEVFKAEHKRREDLERRARELGRRFYAKKTRSAERHGFEQPVDPAGVQCEPFLFLEGAELDQDVFDALWTRGEPIVVDNLQGRFQKIWDPKTFIDRSGSEECSVIDCQTHDERRVSVAEFFARFGESGETREDHSWKLKDWPTDSEFKTKFPDLYEDFSQALPGPDFTRRDGALNISSFFPALDNRPDIGPKMYNAFAGVEAGGSHKGIGTTRLHMDMADAINIMTFAQNTDNTPALTTTASEESTIWQGKSPSNGTNYQETTSTSIHTPGDERRPSALGAASETEDVEMGKPAKDDKNDKPDSNGLESTEGACVDAKKQDPTWQRVQPAPSPTGCAVWDIYRAEDSNAIRDYLTEKWKGHEKFSDPIHSQIFYLNADHRQELFEKKGVFAHRIYQYPGQAVFIPAGCAHQVCNLADCIKIACDFVSPHNVERCLQLAREFRSENTISFAWKDDVLQFSNTLWFAWLSCNTLDKIADQSLAEMVKAPPQPDAAPAKEEITSGALNGCGPQIPNEETAEGTSAAQANGVNGLHDAAAQSHDYVTQITPHDRPTADRDHDMESSAHHMTDSANPLELLANQAQKQERLASPATIKPAAPDEPIAPRSEPLREPSDEDIADHATRQALQDLLEKTPTTRTCFEKVDQPQEMQRLKPSNGRQVSHTTRTAVAASSGTLRTTLVASYKASNGKDKEANGREPSVEGLVRMTSPSPSPSTAGQGERTAEDSDAQKDGLSTGTA